MLEKLIDIIKSSICINYEEKESGYIRADFYLDVLAHKILENIEIIYDDKSKIKNLEERVAKLEKINEENVKAKISELETKNHFLQMSMKTQ